MIFPYVLCAAQIIILIIASVILWQVWKLLVLKDIPDDKPLSDKQVQVLHKKLKLLVVLVAAETVVSIIQAVLRFVDGL